MIFPFCGIERGDAAKKNKLCPSRLSEDFKDILRYHGGESKNEESTSVHFKFSLRWFCINRLVRKFQTDPRRFCQWDCVILQNANFGDGSILDGRLGL